MNYLLPSVRWKGLLVNIQYASTAVFATVVTIALSALYSVSHAQDSSFPTVEIASPTAASLGMFADVPVNYHTGIPSTNLPLHEINHGPISLPIALSYHGGGLKVAEKSSWVGAGFALNAGGAITRSVRGRPDEEQTYDDIPSYLNPGGWYNYLVRDGKLDFNPGGSPFGLFKDFEPDLFFFNFGRYTGKFYINPDLSVSFVDHSDIKAQLILCKDTRTPCSATSGRIYRIVMTTPDGVTYRFGVDENNDAVERSSSITETGGNSFDYDVYSTWYLYQVESADGFHTVDLSYADETFSYYTTATFPERNATQNTGIQLVKNNIFGKRLSTITYGTNQVTFVPDDVPREDLSSGVPQLQDFDNQDSYALKKIEISNQDGFCKSFVFDYDYFSSNTPLKGDYSRLESTYSLHTDKKRLKLNSLTEQDCAGTITKPSYVFNYYQADEVPRTLSFAQDHWGFYNGADNNGGLMPSVFLKNGDIISSSLATGNDRDAAWPAMRAGTLESYEMPTGGITRLTYEPHSIFAQNEVIREENAIASDNAVGNNGETSSNAKEEKFYEFETSPGGTVYKITARQVSNENDDGSGVAFIRQLIDGEWVRVEGASVAVAGTQDRSAKLIQLPAGGTYRFIVTSSSPFPTGLIAELIPITRYERFEEVTVGGLRVATVTHDSRSTSPLITYRYRYQNDQGVNQGVLFSRPQYVALAKNDNIRLSGVARGVSTGGTYETSADPSDGCRYVEDQRIQVLYSPGSIAPLRTTQGAHFGYNQVTVEQSDGGYTTYQYKLSQSEGNGVAVTAIDNSECSLLAPNYPAAPEPYEYARGELREMSVYSAQDQLLRHSEYFTEYTYEDKGTWGLIIRYVLGVPFSTFYRLETARPIKQSELVTNYYDQNGTTATARLLKETFYESNFHTFPTRVTEAEVTAGDKLSNVQRGRILNETRRTYVNDLVLPTVATDNPCGDLSGQLDALAQAFAADRAACNNNADCEWYTWTTYVIDRNQTLRTYAECNHNDNSRRRSDLRGVLSQADATLQPLIQLSLQNKVSGVIESSSWDNDQFLRGDFTYYKAFSEGAIFPTEHHVLNTDVPLASGSYTRTQATNATLTPASGYELETDLVFSGGRLVQMTDRSGVPITYLWGYSRSVPVARIVGATYEEVVALGGFGDDFHAGTGGLSPSQVQTLQSQLPNAQITTYTYDLLVGIATQTDPNSRVTHHEYDDLGRLQWIEDHDRNILQRYDYQYQQSYGQ